MKKSIKPLTKKQKRERIPFELDIGNFCCPKLHKAFKECQHDLRIKYLANTYYVMITCINENTQNYCPYCLTLIDEFFYIKQY